MNLEHVLQVPSNQGIRIAAQSTDIKPIISNLGGSLQHLLTPAYSPILIEEFWEIYSLQSFNTDFVFTYQQLTLDHASRASTQSHAILIPKNEIQNLNLFSLGNLAKEDGQGNKISFYKKTPDNTIQSIPKISIPSGEITLEQPMIEENKLLTIANNLLEGNNTYVNLKINNIGSDYKNRSEICRNTAFMAFHRLQKLNKPISFITYSPNESILDRYNLLIPYTNKYQATGFDEIKLNSESTINQELSELFSKIKDNNWTIPSGD